MTTSCIDPASILNSFLKPQSLSDACAFFLSQPTGVAPIALKSYITLFALTCLLEAPIYLIWKQKLLSPRGLAEQVLIVNLATHPVVIYVMPQVFHFLHQPYQVAILASELFAIIVEAIILRRFYGYSIFRSAGASFSANLFSWTVGLWFN